MPPLPEPQVAQAELREPLASQLQVVAVQPLDALQVAAWQALPPQLAVWPALRVSPLAAQRQAGEA